MNAYPAIAHLSPCADASDWLWTQPDTQTAWNTCHRGDWMMWLLSRSDIDKHISVTLAGRFARMALTHVPLGDSRPLAAIEAAEALTISKVTAQRWLYDGRRHIPPYCGRKIAALCLSRGKALIQIGEDWLRYSDDQEAAHKANKKNPPPCPPGGFLTAKKR